MLANRFIIRMVGQMADRAKRIPRNSVLTMRNTQQQKLCPQQQYKTSNCNRVQSLSTSSSTSTLLPQSHSQSRLHSPSIKRNLYKNCLKGSVCLVLLPVSTVSCTATLKHSTAPSTLNKSSTGTSNSDETTTTMTEDYKNAKSIYDFTVKDTHGNDVSLDKYKGNVVLVVNIASQCGLTKNNYKKLTDLKEQFHDKGLRILNFPCNQFGSQMPEQDGEAMVCHLRDAKADIGDVFQKVDVNGSNAAPIYQYLKAKQSGTLGSAIKWNFTKFLVNKEGIPVNRYAPTTDPMDIVKDIEKLL